MRGSNHPRSPSWTLTDPQWDMVVPPTTITGALIIDGREPNEHLTLVVREESDDVACGKTSEARLMYILAVRPPCDPGDVLKFALTSEGQELIALKSHTLVSGKNDNVDLSFESPGGAVPGRDDPLLDTTTTLVIVLSFVAVTGLLLTIMVVSEGEAANQYRRQVEALVMTSVVVALIILGLAEKVGDQGLVSILGTIAGYSVARAAQERNS